MNFLKQILQEKTPEGFTYSQGRVYLLISIVAYYATLGIMTYKSIKPTADIDLEPEKLIIEALQWAMALFAGYVFGGKGLETLKLIFNKTAGASTITNPPAPAAPEVTP